MRVLFQTVNKDCQNSCMKHTAETANGNKIITGFILIIKNITQHLANQLRHAVTSFWWCSQLYSVDPWTMQGPADSSDALQKQKCLSIWCSLQEWASLYAPGWISHLSSLYVIEHLQGSNMQKHRANSILPLYTAFLLFHLKGSRNLSIKGIYFLLKRYKSLCFSNTFIYFQKVSLAYV